MNVSLSDNGSVKTKDQGHGNDVSQWRSTIGGFAFGATQQIVNVEKNFKGDA
jgi:hypothetical protein